VQRRGAFSLTRCWELVRPTILDPPDLSLVSPTITTSSFEISTTLSPNPSPKRKPKLLTSV
jgi:hypothetical protein